MGWYNNNWPYRVKITIDKSKVGGADLTDFPVYVNLANLPAGFHSHVRADGGDIRVTKSDGVTEIPREVVFYNPDADAGELHFKADLSSTSNTDFYIYYGNSSAQDYPFNSTYGRNNVWTIYSGVWHLNESSGSAIDSTSGGNHGTFSGDLPDTGRDGKLGKCQDFDGSGDMIVMSSGYAPGSGDFSLSAWIYPDAADNDGIMSCRSFGGDYHWWDFRILNGCLDMYFCEPSGEEKKSDDLNHPLNSWYHVVFVRKAGVATYFYTNSSKTTRSDFSKNPNATDGLTIGNIIRTMSFYFDGLIDECRIAVGKALTDSWITCEYNNQSSPLTFYTVFEEEAFQIPAKMFEPRKVAFSGYHCFIEQYVKNKFLGVTPYKLPDGTIW